MMRSELLARLEAETMWDILIIGGGATGLGVALDAASRGYKTLLLEQDDFCKGTSSRSTKLIHGGVRYLAQGNVRLVSDALHERGLLLKNAPDLVHPLPMVIPVYRSWQVPYYLTGLNLYDLLAGGLRIGWSRFLSKSATMQRVPGLSEDGLRGGILFHDAQFDDARLGIRLASAAAAQGALVLNHFRVESFIKSSGQVTGVEARDRFSRREFTLRARGVVNATGIFSDTVRKLDSADSPDLIAFSQGSHVVLDRGFLPSETAVLIPRTDDGRVLFAIPWNGKVLAGTTDLPVPSPELEPSPMQEEIEFILSHLGRLLARQPQTKDVLSMFAGLRPLVKARGGVATSALSRDHVVLVSDSGLVSTIGGKWTTYRKMAEDTVDRVVGVAGLEGRACTTESLSLEQTEDARGLAGGLERGAVDGNAETNSEICGLPAADVLKAVHAEWACTVEDVLSRRTRTLLLDARKAIEMAPRVAELMAAELSMGPDWVSEQVESFRDIAKRYLPSD
ncbi:MAG: glycerol-3-phosphate dehydrogenase/oxidase [Acidobacteriota bacterium]|nr:MAG: glycerol-3-phosphate dehydrogenase/oxidase [Acidobacteriota bacterium]